jgi:hypothetical protein
MKKIRKKTWDCLKEVTLGERNRQKISEIISQNKSVTDETEIAKEFNNFFSEIGPKISNSVPHVNKDPASYILDYDQNKPKFEFDIPGPVHVIDIVKSFDSKASVDIVGLSLKFLKAVIYDISVPLAHIFKLSLENGIFPEKLKYTVVGLSQFLRLEMLGHATIIDLFPWFLHYRKF